jgi:hypothetical protein
MYSHNLTELVTLFKEKARISIDGKCPYLASMMLCPSLLIALSKPDNGIRLIAVGEVLYRLVSTYVTHANKKAIINIVKPIQLGVGVPEGCEFVIHTLQYQLTNVIRYASALCIDFKNAFNTIDRAHVLQSLGKKIVCHIVRYTSDSASTFEGTLLLKTCWLWIEIICRAPR